MMRELKPPNHPWFLWGLFLSTMSVLLLEILDTRLLSVIAWYHISFFAVSMAMFGLSAGAVHVYLGGEKFSGDRARDMLEHYGMLFALSIPVTHLLNLCIPLNEDPSLTARFAMVLACLILAAPFYLGGVVVSTALTRIPGPIGLTYAGDLAGASLGALLIIPLLEKSNITSAAFATGTIACLAVLCFKIFNGSGKRARPLVLAALLLVLAVWNNVSPWRFRVLFSKGLGLIQNTEDIDYEAWNVYSHVATHKPIKSHPFYWGVGEAGSRYSVQSRLILIDGFAGTPATSWDGRIDSLAWTQHDISALPYHLRKQGNVAILGVGGGRDILAALWAQSRLVTGIEINKVLIDLLTRDLREFTNLADRHDVRLIHDEARSYLTRTREKYDIVQMSLIDTYAASGAGAYALTENGLYTREAWKVFLDTLKPKGLFSVSRWIDPTIPTPEFCRLLALGVASLLDQGVKNPSEHLVILSCNKAGTLLVSKDPLDKEDLAMIEKVAQEQQFRFVLFPGRATDAHPIYWKIASSRSWTELHSAISDDRLDYSPPTDQRPYYFNMLKPLALITQKLPEGWSIHGNLQATLTLLLLAVIAFCLVAGVIIHPLWKHGLPQMAQGDFFHTVLYFALIGLGFMFLQIPWMQRFSLYIGHPTGAIAIVLFSMILFAGLGSLISDRVPIDRHFSWILLIPFMISALILILTLNIQRIIDSTIKFQLLERSLIVIGLTAPLSTFLGFCFPLGMRLTKRLSKDAMPWMWGVNGACGVMASITAVAVSMWVGIDVNFYIALTLYAALAIPALSLWRKGKNPGQ